MFLYRDGGDEKSELLRQFCGTSTKETTLATTGSNVFIRLITDYETTQRGFNLTWDAKSPRKLWKYTSLSRIKIWQPLIKLPTFIYTATPSLSYWENVFEIVIILNIPHPLILLKITLKTNTF